MTAYCASETKVFIGLLSNQSMLHLTNQNSRGGAQESVYVVRSPEDSENQLDLTITPLL